MLNARLTTRWSAMYPSLLRRYLSTFIDTVVIFLLLFAFSRSPLYDRNSTEPVLWPLWLFVIFEPLLTSFACTPGQFAMRFRVRRAYDLRRPWLHTTFLRWFVKAALGIISVLYLPAQKQRRALHDLASGTIVLNGSGPFRSSPNAGALAVLLCCLLAPAISRADGDALKVARDIGAVLAWRVGPDLMEHG